MELTLMMILLMILVFFTLVKSQGTHQDNDTFNVTKRAPTTAVQCGRQAKAHPPRLPASEGSKYLVIGGVEAKAHSWPWMVMIRGIGEFVCGGTVIGGNGFNSSLILTAAHCLCGYDQNNVSTALNVLRPDIFQVCAGGHNSSGGCQMARVVFRIDVHPGFHFTPWSTKYDIAVITLGRPLVFTDQIRPICLNPDNVGVPPCLITGWGAINANGDRYPSALQQLSMEPHSDACKKYAYPNTNLATGICASARNGAGGGLGDSGGPLACRGKSGQWNQVGVLSKSKEIPETGDGLIYATLTKYVKCKTDTCQFVY